MYYYHIFTLGSLTFILKVTPKPILRTLTHLNWYRLPTCAVSLQNKSTNDIYIHDIYWFTSINICLFVCLPQLIFLLIKSIAWHIFILWNTIVYCCLDISSDERKSYCCVSWWTFAEPFVFWPRFCTCSATFWVFWTISP